MSATANKTSRTLEPFFARAAEQGERGMSVIRMGLAALVLVRIVGFEWAAFAAGDAKPWISFGAALAGLLASGAILLLLSRHGARPAILAAGVALDGLVFTVCFFPVAWWPNGYEGILRAPDAAFLLMSTVVAGIRLDVRIAIASAALNFASLVGYLVLDRWLQANGHLTITYEVTDVVIWSMLFAGAAAMGISLASRTRRLVHRGASFRLDEERTRQRLGAYVSEEVAREVLAEGDLRVGGTRKEVAVLFADLRGFTRYAETLAPEQLVSELNDYLDAMVRVIRAEGGVVDKFVGDAIMAVFGGFDRETDAADRAIRAARAMHRALGEHNRDRARRGLPGIAQGIGVHYGAVVAGNIGNADRLQYTVIGDTVNLASRLESATKEMRVPILISEEAMNAATVAPRMESLGSIKVKGRRAAIQVFTPAEFAASNVVQLMAVESTTAS